MNASSKFLFRPDIEKQYIPIHISHNNHSNFINIIEKSYYVPQ